MTAHYCGGLVGINRGTVENCHTRLRGTAPSNFGYFVGDNTDGTVKYSYAPQPTSQYTVTGKESTLDGVGTYGITQLPYLYAHRDTQVAASNDYVSTDANADKQLMNVLNRWVDTINSKQSAITYTKWGRPWQESDAVKPLNDDYPILRMPLSEAVASEAGDPYLYYGTVDNLMEAYTGAGSAIWMYNNSASVTGEGVLQVFDMTGRMVASQELHDVQTTVSLPNAAKGVYVLRLTEGKQSRIQKMVISK